YSSTERSDHTSQIIRILGSHVLGHAETLIYACVLVFLSSSSAVSHRSTEKDVLEWEDKRGHAHLDGGFGYFDGNLVVPRDGNYKVYVQITYEKYDDFPCEEELRLFQWVYRFQQSYPDNVTLMSSVDTMSCSMTRPKKSLYASAVFPLKAKDRLWVRSSHPELICHEEHQVFFGWLLLWCFALS
uniref:THD domain-containing protein n=1 Tax=Myripristis murdjan TaxID=586833 RepID=A0A667YFL3_9TELE